MAMSSSSTALRLVRLQNFITPCRWSNTLSHQTVEIHRKSKLADTPEQDQKAPKEVAPREYKYVFPEFLPDPTWWKRDRITERLERREMMRRRAVIEIPEFYVGSIMAVTVSDQYAPGKKNRFVGICIAREGHGLRANFILRNVVDGQGIEIMYELYNPVIQKIEVLKLEKRLDDRLFYLRDAPQEYSTVPFDMEAVTLPPGAQVPVNTTTVPLKPPPWHERWERQELKGATLTGLKQSRIDRAEELATPWEKYDLMKQYRKEINPIEVSQIMKEVYAEQKKIDSKRNKRSTLKQKASV